MGYALFTARKLMLQNRLNQLNYRAMVLTQQEQNLAVQAANLQQVMGLRSSQTSIYAANQIAGAYNNKSIVDEDKLEQYVNTVKANMDAFTKTQNGYNDVDAAQLKSIQVVENQMDLEMKKIETQIKTTTAEMENVEKAEETAIKNAAPDYQGGAG